MADSSCVLWSVSRLCRPCSWPRSLNSGSAQAAPRAKKKKVEKVYKSQEEVLNDRDLRDNKEIVVDDAACVIRTTKEALRKQKRKAEEEDSSSKKLAAEKETAAAS